MKNFTDMVIRTKLKLIQRGRLRTTTKLAILFCVSSVLSVAIALIFLLNISTPKELFGESYKRDEANGSIEVPQQKLLTSFEVKQLDAKNNEFGNDTSVQFKRFVPVNAY
jgi:hypothetical protein